MRHDVEDTRDLGWKVSLSIIVGVGWLVFLILWLFFYSSYYNPYQNISVFFMSVLIIVIILGIPWMICYSKNLTEKEKEMWKTKGFKSRIWLSTIIAFMFIFFLIYWFWYLAKDYSLYQNIAIFIVSILVMGGIIGSAWAPWGIKHGHKFDEKTAEKK